MTTYKCDKCDKIFVHKNDYNKHINKKKPCNKNNKAEETNKEIKKYQCNRCNKQFTWKYTLYRHEQKYCNKDNHQNNVDDSNNQNICKFCKKYLSRSDSLRRHISICKNKKDDDKSIEIYDIIKSIPDPNKDEIFKKLLEMVNTKSEHNIINVNTTNNTTNTTNTTNNNNINNGIVNNIEIKILPYGKEDLSYITDKDYKYFIKKGFQSVPELVKYIHFNNCKPEYHNIYISNMRDNYIMVFDGKGWKLQNKKDVLDDMYHSKKEILEEKFNELYKELSESAKRKFDRFLNDEQDKKVVDNIKEDLKLVLYNNRKIPEKTKKKIN